MFQRLVEDYEQAHDVPAVEVAAALAKLFRGDVPLLLKPEPKRPAFEPSERAERGERAQRAPRHEREEGGERSFRERPAFPKKERVARDADAGMQTFRIEVGYDHGVKPGNIVGAIANEAGIDAAHIGRIQIFDAHSTVDLPDGMPRPIQQRLRKAWVCGQQLEISVDSGGDTPPKRLPPAVRADRPRERHERPHRKRSHE
jgi:ATP-dependent RNA helicase DeaD